MISDKNSNKIDDVKLNFANVKFSRELDLNELDEVSGGLTDEIDDEIDDVVEDVIGKFTEATGPKGDAEFKDTIVKPFKPHSIRI